MGTGNRIFYTAPPRVYANSFAARTWGRYALSVRELAP